MPKQTDQNQTSIETYLKLVKNADYTLLNFTDLLGYQRGRTIPAEQTKDVLTEGAPFDGSSIFGGATIEESDMVMKPDPTTFTVYPYYFYDKSVATFICNIQKPDGTQYKADPRNILQQAITKATAEGYEPTAAAELEFYLIEKDDKGQIVPVENHITEKQRYFDNSPDRDITETYRMNLSNALTTIGLTIERQHHEVGSAQNEITFKYSNPITTSDNITRYKFAAKAVAQRKHNWIATFMPKPWAQKPGSGMHIHMTLFDPHTNKNRFYNPNDYAHISQTARYFIGGILNHSEALSAIVAPTINSYKRLVPGYEAPVYIAWSKNNRSALMRIPAFPSNNEREARIEFRCPDPLCNPYLTYTAILAAGLDGIKKKTEPSNPTDTNLYHLTETQRKKLNIKTLPTTLKEALEKLQADEICCQAIGKENAEKYIELKTEEYKQYKQDQKTDTNEVTQWELQKYLYA